MKTSSVKTINQRTVKPENIKCKVGDFGLILKMKSTNTNGQLYYEDTKLDSMPREELPSVLWGPECQWQGGKRYFTEYSDVFTFGMLMWELFQIMGECRKNEKCQCGKCQCKKCQFGKYQCEKCQCGKCKPHKTMADKAGEIKSEKFLTSRQEALPVPTLLKMKNDAMQDLKYSETLQRMFKCWKYQSKDKSHQKT